MRALFILLLCGLSIGCAATPEPRETVTVTVHQVPEPPAELTACAPRPAVAALPADPTAQAYLLARLLIQAFAAGDDCRSTLDELVAWLREAAAQVETRRAP